MDNALQLLRALRVPRLYREVIALIGGLGFLLIIWVAKLRYLDFTFGLDLNGIERDFLVLVISYLTGKIILFVSKILIMADGVVNYLCASKPRQSKNITNRVREYFAYKSFFERVDAREVESMITAA